MVFGAVSVKASGSAATRSTSVFNSLPVSPKILILLIQNTATSSNYEVDKFNFQNIFEDPLMPVLGLQEAAFINDSPIEVIYS
jgi:hypothetical protein